MLNEMATKVSVFFILAKKYIACYFMI